MNFLENFLVLPAGIIAHLAFVFVIAVAVLGIRGFLNGTLWRDLSTYFDDLAKKKDLRDEAKLLNSEYERLASIMRDFSVSEARATYGQFSLSSKQAFGYQTWEEINSFWPDSYFGVLGSHIDKLSSDQRNELAQNLDTNAQHFQENLQAGYAAGARLFAIYTRLRSLKLAASCIDDQKSSSLVEGTLLPLQQTIENLRSL